LIGNLGFIAYVGAASFDESEEYFQAACQYMAETKPATVVLLGHWNSNGAGCVANMSVPEVYKEIQKFEGCDIGDKLKYFDGHVHCNKKQGAGHKEEVGFMIGGHGMSGCGQYGFGYVDSTGGKLRVWYFEERNASEDKYPLLRSCLQQHGGQAGLCLHLAELWLESDL
jgi:hypothetical protein